MIMKLGVGAVTKSRPYIVTKAVTVEEAHLSEFRAILSAVIFLICLFQL